LGAFFNGQRQHLPFSTFSAAFYNSFGNENGNSASRIAAGAAWRAHAIEIAARDGHQL
jgi:hypothetical protein